MKKITISLVLTFLTLVSSANEPEIIKIILQYQSSFSNLPELYEIRLEERSIDYISPINMISSGKQKRVTRTFGKKKWKELTRLIETTRFDSINSSTGHGIDGGWYSMNIEFSDGKLKELKIWSEYAPDALLELHKLMMKNR